MNNKVNRSTLTGLELLILGSLISPALAGTEDDALLVAGVPRRPAGESASDARSNREAQPPQHFERLTRHGITHDGPV